MVLKALDWGEDAWLVLKKAWSMRFMAVSFISNAVGIVLSTWGSFSHSFVWSIVLQLLGLVFISAAFVARLVKQKDLA